MALPMLPILDGNGLGELYLALFGADDNDRLGSTAAYDHEFAWSDLAKTFTIWLKYVERYQKIRMNAIDSHDLEIKNTGELTLDFATKGADKQETTLSDWGTEQFITLATAKQITGLGCRLEYGEPGCAAREAWENLKLSYNRNMDAGAPGKAGQHAAGSGSPQIMTSTKSECKLTLDIRDTDGMEEERWRSGTNATPNADRQTDLIALVKARISIYGQQIGRTAGICIDQAIGNTGTTTATAQGTYSGSGVKCWEVYITQGTPDTYKFRSRTDNGAWSDWSTPANITAGPDAIENGVTITFSSTTDGLTGDLWYVSTHASEANAEADYCNAGTATLAVGGVYTGADALTVYEIKLVNAATDTYVYRKTTGGAWSAWSTPAVAITASEQAFVDGLTLTFSSTTLGSEGDRFYISSHYRYMLRHTLPNLVFEKFTPKLAGGKRTATLEFYHTSASALDRPFANMYNATTATYA
jgi:hypothetical protein